MITHFAGDSLIIDVPVLDAAGQPFPLAGAALEYNARPAFYDGFDEVALTLGNGISILTPNTARVIVPAGAIELVGQWVHSFTVSNNAIGTQTLWAEPINVLPIGTANP